MSYKPGDMVRIVKDHPRHSGSSMIRSYRGSDAKVVDRMENNRYLIEIDQPYAIGGAPRFVVSPAMIYPDVTPAMLRAGQKAVKAWANFESDDTKFGAIYRAMRAARFDP